MCNSHGACFRFGIPTPLREQGDTCQTSASHQPPSCEPSARTPQDSDTPWTASPAPASRGQCCCQEDFASSGAIDYPTHTAQPPKPRAEPAPAPGIARLSASSFPSLSSSGRLGPAARGALTPALSPRRGRREGTPLPNPPPRGREQGPGSEIPDHQLSTIRYQLFFASSSTGTSVGQIGLAVYLVWRISWLLWPSGSFRNSAYIAFTAGDSWLLRRGRPSSSR